MSLAIVLSAPFCVLSCSVIITFERVEDQAGKV